MVEVQNWVRTEIHLGRQLDAPNRSLHKVGVRRRGGNGFFDLARRDFTRRAVVKICFQSLPRSKLNGQKKRPSAGTASGSRLRRVQTSRLQKMLRWRMAPNIRAGDGVLAGNKCHCVSSVCTYNRQTNFPSFAPFFGLFRLNKSVPIGRH